MADMTAPTKGQIATLAMRILAGALREKRIMYENDPTERTTLVGIIETHFPTPIEQIAIARLFMELAMAANYVVCKLGQENMGEIERMTLEGGDSHRVMETWAELDKKVPQLSDVDDDA